MTLTVNWHGNKGYGRAVKGSFVLVVPAYRKGEPLVVYIHGGGFDHGDKAGDSINPNNLRWLWQGYAMASINYRLLQHALWPAQIEDCKAAIRWLRAHADAFGIDPDRIGVWGASAGGFLAALLGSAGVPVKFYPVEGAGHGAYFGAAVSDFMPIRRSNRW